ncbi:hypothetical protein [Syntrophomonas curvata]
MAIMGARKIMVILTELEKEYDDLFFMSLEQTSTLFDRYLTQLQLISKDLTRADREDAESRDV